MCSVCFLGKFWGKIRLIDLGGVYVVGWFEGNFGQLVILKHG